ncbi:kinase-like domain-containing protein [Cladorrhinum sp. PSN332]|nr:kinase-like domain-containing protein [Cladorrhinum sp. PSN332]
MMTALEISDPGPGEDMLFALQGEHRQRAIPRMNRSFLILINNIPYFALLWARPYRMEPGRDISANQQRQFAVQTHAMQVSELTAAPDQPYIAQTPQQGRSYQLRRRRRSDRTASGQSTGGYFPGSLERSLHDYKKLGDGGYADVHKVVDLATGDLWAVKKIKHNETSLELVRRWHKVTLAELEVLNRVRHQHIVHFEGCRDFSLGGRVELIFSLYEGSLHDLLTGTLEIDTDDMFLPHWYRRLVQQIIAALEYLHFRPRPIIHRDIKPSNIMFRLDPNQGHYDFFLGDFGVSASRGTISRGAGGAGTRFYQAPEVILNSRNAAMASDIWALGITFMEAMGFVFPDEAHAGTGYWAAKLKHHGYRGEYTDPNMNALDSQTFSTRLKALAQFARVPPAVVAMFSVDEREYIFGNPSYRPCMRQFWEMPAFSAANENKSLGLPIDEVPYLEFELRQITQQAQETQQGEAAQTVWYRHGTGADNQFLQASIQPRPGSNTKPVTQRMPIAQSNQAGSSQQKNSVGEASEQGRGVGRVLRTLLPASRRGKEPRGG